MDPNAANVYALLAKAYKAKGDIDKAIVNYSKAIELDSDYAEAYHERGNAYVLKGDFDHVLEDYTKVLELEPHYGPVYYNRALAWLQRREWDKARADLVAARNCGINSFRNDPQNVLNFEQSIGVKLPKDISTMLMQRGGQTQTPPKVKNRPFEDHAAMLAQQDLLPTSPMWINQFQGQKGAGRTSIAV